MQLYRSLPSAKHCARLPGLRPHSRPGLVQCHRYRSGTWELQRIIINLLCFRSQPPSHFPSQADPWISSSSLLAHALPVLRLKLPSESVTTSPKLALYGGRLYLNFTPRRYHLRTLLSGHVPSTTSSPKILWQPPRPSPFMSLVNSRKRKRDHGHPYLSGNFAPVHNVLPLTPCTYTGEIPKEVWGGEYVRNGGNPVTNEDLGRDAHWFDGDGMLSGVAFKRDKTGVQPLFVNQYILTDMYISSISSKSLRTPVLPSIATLVNPASSLLAIILRILRTILLVILSHLPGSEQAIKKISVANTGILFHDGRALATCESGPPMRVTLPALETVGWYNGKRAEGEKDGEEGSGFGGDGLLSFMKEWTTAHPRVDPRTGSWSSSTQHLHPLMYIIR